jgi:hypothetical protein
MFLHLSRIGHGRDQLIRVNGGAVAYYYPSDNGSTLVLTSGEAFEVRTLAVDLDKAWSAKRPARRAAEDAGE